MPAITVSNVDERRIARLGKRLGVRSEARVVRIALAELERRVERSEMGAVIREYVRKHGALDRRENVSLGATGVRRCRGGSLTSELSATHCRARAPRATAGRGRDSTTRARVD